MSKIGNSLKKKWGPLPAWAWLLGGGLLYYFYRKYSSTAAASGTGTGSVAPAAATPQPGQVLEPGESYYDPNTGSLSTAPGGGDTGTDTTSADALTSAMNNLANAIATGMPATDTGQATPTVAGTPAATTSTGGAKGKPKLTARGALYAPFGHNRPAAKAGFTIKGLGRGFWEYVPKAKAKSKGQTNAGKKTSKPVKPSAKIRARSAATVRTTTAGRTTARAASVAHRTTVNRSVSTPQQPSRARQRPKQPAAQQVVQQRRPASMPRPSPTRQAGSPAPRPSAPPPRTQRAPAPKPRPKSRARG